MSACKWMADMLLAMFTVYLFFLYFGMFFERRKKNIRVLLGIIVLVLWQVGIPEVINELPKAWNIGTTVGLALFVVVNVFEGKRKIILMSYFLDMTEKEIAECMNLVQSTVHYHKADSLRLLKKLLE